MTISGRVQGVGFRYSARRQGAHLHINGYVRNLPNGDVEIVAEGEDANVDEMIRWARQGPSWARVRHVEVKEEPYEGEFYDFGVRF